MTFFSGNSHRQNVDAGISESFIKYVKQNNILLTVHWDGKLMSNTTNDGTENSCVDRIPIVVSGKTVEKTLYVPKVASGKLTI